MDGLTPKQEQVTVGKQAAKIDQWSRMDVWASMNPISRKKYLRDEEPVWFLVASGRFVNPAPFGLTKRERRFWDEYLNDVHVRSAMARSRTTFADVCAVYDKIRAFFDAMAFKKLAALRECCRHLGMIGPLRNLMGHPQGEPPIPLEHMVLLATNPQCSPVRRCALAMLLDYYDAGWRSKLTPEQLGNILEREDREVALWKRAVLKRDGRKCQRCGSGDRLHVDHIVPWAIAPHLRVEVANGRTLCESCHGKRHNSPAEFAKESHTNACRSAD